MGIVNRKQRRTALLALLFVAAFSVAILASDAELYFSSDKNGENRVTQVSEGDEIWIVVQDGDEDIDCDVRDKIWTDIKVMDTKTGAHIVWRSYIDEKGADVLLDDGVGDTEHGEEGYVPHQGHSPGATAGWLGGDFLEETGASTGIFVSRRAFQVGTRVSYSNDGRNYTHIVGPYTGIGPNVTPTDFEWGNYLYAEADGNDYGDDRIWVDRAGGFVLALDGVVDDRIPRITAGAATATAYLPPGVGGSNEHDYMFGRFENMDTLIGMYVDQNDASDVAITMGKISDTEATIRWGMDVYSDANEAATLLVEDADENVSCNDIDRIPVFVIVNPGSWNPQTPTSATDFCELKRYGGVKDLNGNVLESPLVWYTMYDSGLETADVNLAADGSDQPNADGTYYIDYPVAGDGNVTSFDTASASGVTRVMFYADETGVNTGVFQLNFNSLLEDLGFESLNVRDVLAAYYLDPNDQDDFCLALAYIEEKQHSSLRFTDASRADEEVFWLGRDPVYVEVVDSNANTDSCCPETVIVHVCDPHEVDDVEYLILDELSSNSSVFFTNVGMKLISVWDAMGTGDTAAHGGYSLMLDNWSLEAFNEDSVYVRYNDVIYVERDIYALGDADTGTVGATFGPRIEQVRSANDVSFAVFEVGDTQVYDGEIVTMYFLDRNGDRVAGYVNSDCVFVEVVDPDQDEDRNRRERLSGFWDGFRIGTTNGQELPFGPVDDPDNHNADCGYFDIDTHPVNTLLGDTNIFSSGSYAKLYVFNPRNGRWAPVDLLETGIDSGSFVSVTCIDLVSQYDCAPSLGVLPGDTLIAAYQDPSNHSDIAWISIKVGIGGAVSYGSTATFTDEAGNDVAAYVMGDPMYVKVVDTSMSGAGTIPDAVTLDGATHDLAPLAGAPAGTFITGPIEVTTLPGDTVTATYVDPADSTDTSTATVQIVALELSVESFYTAPNPFSDVVSFAYWGDGMAETMTVVVYDLSGKAVWRHTAEDVLLVEWDGTNERGELLANGAYLYAIAATGGGHVFADKGTLFIYR